MPEYGPAVTNHHPFACGYSEVDLLELLLGYFLRLQRSFQHIILLVRSLAAGIQAASQEVGLDLEVDRTLEVVARLVEGILAVVER